MGLVSTLVSIASLAAAAACSGGKVAPPPTPLPASPDATRADERLPQRDSTPRVTAGASVPPQGTPKGDQQATGAGLLARVAAQTLLVFPAQAVAPADPLGWRAASGGERVLLASLDAGLEAVLGERGLSHQWVFPPALQRAAKRNPTYVTDPTAVRALGPVREAAKKPDDPLPEPFASQLRSLAGVSDARYAFIPLELRLEPVPNTTTGRAVLQLAVVDARGSRVVWIGEVASDAFPSYAPAVLGSLVRRVADLVVPVT